MLLTAFTLFHVALSLIGIAAGFVVAYGFVQKRLPSTWNHVFLSTTTATTVTGFMFPFHGFTPAIGLGLVSTPVLAVALYAFYGARLAGRWRSLFVISALVAQYFNVFALVTQSFLKIPALHALAPNQNEPPFAIAHLIVLAAFVVLTVASFRGFRAAPAA